MIYHDRTDVSEGTDVIKTSTSKEYDICDYWYFLDEGFKFQQDICNGCHDVSMISVNLNNIFILNIQCVDYYCIIDRISKSDTVNLQQNVDLAEKNGTSWDIFLTVHKNGLKKHQRFVKLKLKNTKKPIRIYDVDINKILVSRKVSFWKRCLKYFIGYKDSEEVRPLYAILQKMRAYRRDFAGKNTCLFW